MWKQFLKWLLGFALNQLFKYVDSDNDGKLDKEEIESIVQSLRAYAKELKKRV